MNLSGFPSNQSQITNTITVTGYFTTKSYEKMFRRCNLVLIDVKIANTVCTAKKVTEIVD